MGNEIKMTQLKWTNGEDVGRSDASKCSCRIIEQRLYEHKKGEGRPPDTLKTSKEQLELCGFKSHKAINGAYLYSLFILKRQWMQTNAYGEHVITANNAQNLQIKSSRRSIAIQETNKQLVILHSKLFTSTAS